MTANNLTAKYLQSGTKEANIAFSTTNYHVFRAGAIAYDQNVKMEGIGAKTKSYFCSICILCHNSGKRL